METRKTKATKYAGLSESELESVKDLLTQRQNQLTKQSEAFNEEREQFEKERDKLANERAQWEKEKETSNRIITELREEARQRDMESQKWPCNDPPTSGDGTTDATAPENNRTRHEHMLRVNTGASGFYNVPYNTKPLFLDPGYPPSQYDAQYDVASPKLSFRDALETVPHFDGYNMSTSAFGRACRHARDTLPPSAERNLTRLLFNRLRGRARSAVEEDTCTTVTQLIDQLTSAFGALKTIDQYRGELSTIYMKRGEHVLDYIDRVKDLKSAIIDTERRENARIDNRMLDEIDSLTARSFCDGLPLEYRLQFGSIAYTKSAEAFAAAKTIARRQELDRTRYEEPDRNPRRSAQFPINPIGNPVAHSTPNRPTRDAHIPRDRYPLDRSRDQPPPRRDYRNDDARSYQRNYPTREFGRLTNPRYEQRNPPPPRRDYQRHETPREREPSQGYGYYRPSYEPRNNGYNDTRYRHGPTQLDRRPENSERWCNYCKIRGHTIDECRRRQYNSRMNVPGNDAGPSARADAPRADQNRPQRPVNMIEATNENQPE